MSRWGDLALPIIAGAANLLAQEPCVEIVEATKTSVLRGEGLISTISAVSTWPLSKEFHTHCD